MQAAQGEMSDIREECNNSIVGVTEQTDLKIAELRENAPVLSMAGIVNTIGEVGFSGRYATTYSHYFVNAESKFYYKPYGAEMPIVSPYPYNIAEGSMGNPSVMFALGDTLYRLDEHPSGIENQMIKYIDAEDLDNAEASMRAVVTAVDSKVDDVDTRTRILSEELNGGDIIVNINKEVGIEDGWFELDSAIANVPARYKYRCGLFITFLWQRPADGEKVWQTYQFKGCDSSGEQEEQWQDTSRWNQMADVRFVVENAMSRCSALEDSQREQDNKITQLQSGKQDKLVSSEDILVDANVLRIADLAKKKVFIDMWNAACEINGKKWGWYDAERDDFLIYPDFRNGEGLHLTYEQAVKCYVVSRKDVAGKAGDVFFGIKDTNAKALLPMRCARHISGEQMMMGVSNVRAVAFVFQSGTTVPVSSLTNTFNNCTALEEIYGKMHVTDNMSGAVFYGCSNLREITLWSQTANFSVADSPLLSLASFQYMLTRTNNNTAITITVHPDCYAKMTGDTTNAAAAALTEEEAAQWQQLLTDAVAKNITFATL